MRANSRGVTPTILAGGFLSDKLQRGMRWWMAS
jgi:hypothetical protein